MAAMILLLCLVIAIVSAVALIAEVNDERHERLRIEHETLKAERRLHDVASDAFRRMLDVTRERRPDDQP